MATLKNTLSRGFAARVLPACRWPRPRSQPVFACGKCPKRAAWRSLSCRDAADSKIYQRTIEIAVWYAERLSYTSTPDFRGDNLCVRYTANTSKYPGLVYYPGSTISAAEVQRQSSYANVYCIVSLKDHFSFFFTLVRSSTNLAVVATLSIPICPVHLNSDHRTIRHCSVFCCHTISWLWVETMVAYVFWLDQWHCATFY